MITRAAPVASPDEPSIPITDVNAVGGTARWNSRLTEPAPPALPERSGPPEPPIADSAALTADTSGDGSSGDAAPNDRRDANSSHLEPVGFTLPNWATADSACATKSVPDNANFGGAHPMIRNFSGSSPARKRWYRPGSSLRLAKSPEAPNSTMT